MSLTNKFTGIKLRSMLLQITTLDKITMILEADSIDKAIQQINRLRMYSPYKYSGKYFIFVYNNETYCYRSKQAVKNKMIRLGLSSVELYQYG